MAEKHTNHMSNKLILFKIHAVTYDNRLRWMLK